MVERSRKTPDWAKSSKKIQDIIETSFPYLEVDMAQRSRAGLWVRAIQLFFVLGMSLADVATEMDLDEAQTKDILRSIKRVASGRTANGKERKKPKIGPVKDSGKKGKSFQVQYFSDDDWYFWRTVASKEEGEAFILERANPVIPCRVVKRVYF